MIAIIATMQVQDGKAEEFERVMLGLAAEVQANEPGNHLYRLCRGEDNTFVVMELYEDDAALAAHGASDHFKAAGPALGGLLAGRPEIQKLDVLG